MIPMHGYGIRVHANTDGVPPHAEKKLHADNKKLCILTRAQTI